MKKKNVRLMILGEVILFVVVFVTYVVLCGGDVGMILHNFLDIPSLLGIIIVSVFGMVFTGNWKDFSKAFSVGRKEYSLMQLKNIVEAVGVCQKLVLYGGVIELVVSFITLCAGIDASNMILIFPNLAVLALSGLYIVVFEYLLLPLKSNAVKVMNEEMDVDYEE